VKKTKRKGQREQEARNRIEAEKRDNTKECRVFVRLAIRNLVGERRFTHRNDFVRFRVVMGGECRRREIDAVDLATSSHLVGLFGFSGEACAGPSPKTLDAPLALLGLSSPIPPLSIGPAS